MASASPAAETIPVGVSTRLWLRCIRKVYPGVLANDGIDLDVAPGEIHAVLGENGAGKSTLMKIIYGAIQPTSGEIRWEGSVVSIDSPARARALGIGMVFQHFSLFETLTVAENVALALPGAPKLDALSARISQVSQRYRLTVEPQRLVHSLSVGERQRVEIVRCLLQVPRLLITDEPTSPCSRRKPCAVCSKPCVAWPPKAAASCISVTSSTRFASSATPLRYCAAVA